MSGTPGSPWREVGPAPRPPRVLLPVSRARPLWTYVFLALNVVCFLGTALADAVFGRGFAFYYGAKVNQAIVAGEYWRLLTAIFLHADLLHLAFNGYALFVFGAQVEGLYGRTRFFIFYLLSGLAGSAASFALSAASSVGASGAIFGLIGAMAAYFYHYRDSFGRLGQRRLINILTVAAYNLFYGFIVPGIDNWGHVGGLVGGLALGWFLAPDYAVVPPGPHDPARVEDRSSLTRRLAVVAVFALALAAVVALGVVRWGT